MMLLHLVKKDILIAKKYVLVIMLFIIAFPLFVTVVAPQIEGLISFLYIVALGEIVLLQVISQEEAKYPKAAALLCASSYPRSTFVKANYTFFLLLFAYCYIAYTLVMLVVNRAGVLDLTAILTVLLVGVIIYGIYIPVEFKFGAVKARFIFTIAILALALGPMLFTDLFANITIDFSALATIPASIKNIVLALVSIAVFSISMMVSIRIFSKKEL